MKNLFDLALEVRYNRYLITGLTEISKSTVFPVIPISLQQKVERLIHALAKENTCILDRWGPDTSILEDFVVFMDKREMAHPVDSNYEFVRNTSSLIRQYVKTSVRHVREALKGVDLTNDMPERTVPESDLPKKRKE